MSVSAKTVLAGVVGAPVRHSLSPRLHNAWLEAAGIDAVYAAFAPEPERFERFVEGLRGGVIAGLNVTIPFKARALAIADEADALSRAAGAANLLLFRPDGQIEARNTDGAGLIGAFRQQAPQVDFTAGPVVIFGAGGAARGAAAALMGAGSPEVRIVNRTVGRAEALAAMLGPSVRAFAAEQTLAVVEDAVALINATSLGLGGGEGPAVPWARTPARAVAMDMVYKPLRTGFLTEAAQCGRATVDGLEMLIRQAIPTFEALFGAPPPPQVDVRGLLLRALEAGG
ncbi:MAG TPA: shikimate dehydrogenase [Caulobacteraceae bacterium]|nr:shikimate dehydrogenase [Caulobacteraceae bacterium]